MDNMIYILFICIALPLLLMLKFLEKESRITMIFMIIGMFMCVFSSEVSGIISRLSGWPRLYLTTTITPPVEEASKALPVLMYAFGISDKREKLISLSMATGIGFAVLENAYILSSNIEYVSIAWALVRAFGSGLMHGICTVMIGIGISFVRKRRKLFCTGTFALLTLAIVYHACYNLLVQSSWQYAGILLPITTYIPIVCILMRKRSEKA